MLALIKPFVLAEVSCGRCEQSCQVVIWNGLKNFDLVPPEELRSQDDAIVTLIKVRYDKVQEFLMYAAHTGSHVADRVLLWCEDEKTYNLAVKLLPNVHTLLESEPDESDEEAAEGTTRHHH